MKTNCRRLILVMILLFLIVACTPATIPAAEPTPITVQLRWTHQAQFAGFYAADQNGYYTEEGLQVNLIEGGPTVDIHKPVLEGASHFGIASADSLILKRADGNAIKAIATIYRRSALVFIALATSGISTPQDFINQTINIPTFNRPILHAITARVGITPDQYTQVQVADGIAALTSGEVTVTSGFMTNEPLTLARMGHKINIIYPDDYGVHFFGDTLYATDNFIAQNPDLVLRFLRATLKGWTYAVENPGTIAPMVLKYKPGADVEHETAFMTASLPLINTGEDFIGWMKPEVWADMERTLREQRVLTLTLDITQVYTLNYLNEIYGK